jgi:hypothetical protein
VKISYLNTDLDVTAPCDLSPLVVALAARGVGALHVTQSDDGAWYSILSAEPIGIATTEPEPTLLAMLDAIEALKGEAKQIWSECSIREFNIGYDCGDEPWAFNNGLSNATLQRIAATGASLRITIYPPVDESKACPKPGS